MKDEQVILEIIKSKRKPQITHYVTRQINGELVQVPVYNETRKRPSTSIRCKRAHQTNDFKLVRTEGVQL